MLTLSGPEYGISKSICFLVAYFILAIISSSSNAIRVVTINALVMALKS